VHPFYTLDTDTPNVAGYDLIAAANLVIDLVGQCAYSYFNTCPGPKPPKMKSQANLYANETAVIRSDDGSLEPVTDVSLLQQEGSSSSAFGKLFDHTVGSSIPTFSPHPVHDLSSTTDVDQSARVSHDSVANMSDATQPESLSHSYPAPLPEHVRLLYETTVKKANLSDGIGAYLCRLLSKHANAFATSSTVLWAC